MFGLQMHFLNVLSGLITQPFSVLPCNRLVSHLVCIPALQIYRVFSGLYSSILLKGSYHLDVNLCI